MKQIDLTFNHWTFNGKYCQRLIFFLMDLNDFFKCPFRFVIGDSNTFRNFRINAEGWKPESTKFAFAKFLLEENSRQFKERA